MKRIDSIYLENFGSHRESGIEFPPGLSLIAGDNLDSDGMARNAAGKSTITEALCWLFFNKTSKGNLVDAVIKRGTDNTEVSAEIECSDGYVNPTRTKKRGKGSHLILSADDVEDYDGNDAQEMLERILGYGYNLFNKAILFGGIKSKTIIDLDTSVRFQMMRNIISSEVYSKAAERLRKEKMPEVELEAEKIQQAIFGYNVSITTLEVEIEDCVDKINDWKDSTNKEVEMLETRLNFLNMVKASDKKMEFLEGTWLNYVNRKEQTISSKRSAEITLERNNTLLLFAEKDSKCPTCHRTFNKLELGSLRQEIESNKKWISDSETAIVEWDKEAREWEEKYRKQKGIFEEIIEIEDKLNEIKSQENPWETKKVDLMKKIEHMNNLVKQMEIEGAKVLERYEDLEFWKDGFRDIENMMMDKLRQWLQFNSNKYVRYLMGDNYYLTFPSQVYTEDGKEKFGHFDIDILEDTEVIDYRTLSNGELRRLDVAIMLSINDYLLQDKDVSVLFADEMLDSPLDTEGVDRLLSLFEYKCREGDGGTYAGLIEKVFGDTLKKMNQIIIISNEERLIEYFDESKINRVSKRGKDSEVQ